MDDAGELCNRLAFMVEGTLPVIDSTQELRLQHGKKTVRVEYSENGLISSEDFPIDQLASNAAFSNILKKPEILTTHTQEASLDLMLGARESLPLWRIFLDIILLMAWGYLAYKFAIRRVTRYLVYK